jgi:arylsulfatase A-like enzyme
MRGEADAAHEAILIEEDGQRVYMGFRGPIRCRTLVTRRWRTTIYHGVEWGELYDLDEDPDELRNLWDDPHHAAVRSHLMELMARKQMALVDRSPLPTAMA